MGVAVVLAGIPVTLAGRGRLISKLIEGDPVAWSILGVVVVGSIGWAVLKRHMRGE